MNELKEMYNSLGISDEVYDYAEEICEKISERFHKIDKIAEYNQLKVSRGQCRKIKSQKPHFAPTTG